MPAMKKILFKSTVLFIVFICSETINAQSFAEKFAASEMHRFPKAYQLDNGKELFFGYGQGVGCCAMLNLWEATGDKRYFNYVKEWADTIIDKNGSIYLYQPEDYHLDFIEPGKVLFEVYKQTGNKKYKLALDKLINQLKTQPRTKDGGFWHKGWYENQMWLDGIYMASPFMARYGAEFNQPEWIDEAIRQILVCRKHTYDSKTGLYYHGWDESKSQRWANKTTGCSPSFWGRGIGWYFMAIVDVLDYIPAEHPQRSELISIIQDLADTLPRYQDKNGLWYQIIDQPERTGNYPEASVSSQCMYAYAKAVNKKYINIKYKSIAIKAYEGIKNHLIRTGSDGILSITNCCKVAGLGGVPYRDESFEYYVGEKMKDNDAKATGPFIMGCIELGE